VSLANVIVLAVGALLIAWELWFFLMPRRGAAAAAPNRSGVQEFRIVVKGGYEPDTILVEADRPVRLSFFRNETVACSEQLVFDTLNISRTLPAFETTTIEFIPKEPGDYPFHCGMGMLKGRVVAQVGRDGARANLGKGHGKHG
jgi:plastocyanin domain-containing protein